MGRATTLAWAGPSTRRVAPVDADLRSRWQMPACRFVLLHGQVEGGEFSATTSGFSERTTHGADKLKISIFWRSRAVRQVLLHAATPTSTWQAAADVFLAARRPRAGHGGSKYTPTPPQHLNSTPPIHFHPLTPSH